VFLEWGLGEQGILPEIWGKEGIGIGESIEGSKDKVSEGLSVTSGLSENILNSGHVQDLLGGSGSDDSSSSGSRNKSYSD